MIRIWPNQKSKPKTLEITTLKQAPVFSDTLMLHACFQVLVDYVKENQLFQDESEYIPPDQVELYRLYQYWTQERPRWIFEERMAREYQDRLEAAEIEERRKDKDEEMLEKLISLRSSLVPC